METYTTIYKIDSQWEFSMSQEIHTGALYQPRRMGWGGRWEREGREVQEGGDIVYLWLIHVEVFQKAIKFYKAIIFQLKNK